MKCALRVLVLTALLCCPLAVAYGQGCPGCTSGEVCVTLPAADDTADLDYAGSVYPPAYPFLTGPRIRIDDTHDNAHAIDRGYEGFKILFRHDGYNVLSFPDSMKYETDCEDTYLSCAPLGSPNVCNFCRMLANTDILLIVNADPASVHPDELKIIREWVALGGGLMVIGDHCPYPVNARTFASEFDSAYSIAWQDNFVNNQPAGTFSGRFCRPPASCAPTDGVLIYDALTQGRKCGEEVHLVDYFSGSSISGSVGSSHMTFPACADDDLCQSVSGHRAGVTMEHGIGRVYLGTEATMFTAMCHGPQCVKQGMQPELGNHNQQYALNVIHWLDGLYPMACPAQNLCNPGCVVPQGCPVTDTCQISCRQFDGSLFTCPSGQTIQVVSCGCTGGSGSICSYYDNWYCN